MVHGHPRRDAMLPEHDIGVGPMRVALGVSGSENSLPLSEHWELHPMDEFQHLQVGRSLPVDIFKQNAFYFKYKFSPRGWLYDFKCNNIVRTQQRNYIIILSQ